MAITSKKERIFIIILSLGLATFGFFILMALAGPTYIKPDFKAEGEILLGVGVMMLMAGTRMLLLIYEPVRENAGSLRALKTLTNGGMYLGIAGIIIGTFHLYFP